MGWGLRGWSGVGGSFLRFCRGAWKSVRAVAEPPSHRKPTSTPHPWRAENMWQLVQQTCIWEKLDGFISSFFSKACQEDSVPRRKQEILDSLVYVSACDPESMHRRTTEQISRPHQKQAPSVFSWGYKSVFCFHIEILRTCSHLSICSPWLWNAIHLNNRKWVCCVPAIEWRIPENGTQTSVSWCW